MLRKHEIAPEHDVIFAQVGADILKSLREQDWNRGPAFPVVAAIPAASGVVKEDGAPVREVW